MKRVFVLLVLVLALAGCLATPAVLPGGNPAPYVAGDLLQIDRTALIQALQLYIDAWGPYDLLQTLLYRGHDSYAYIAWGNDEQGCLHYVKMRCVNGEWIIIEASDLIGVELSVAS